jgi:hypothetical protein
VLQVEKAPWWYVNLLEPYMVQLVRIDFGQSCCGMLHILIQYFTSFDYLSYFIYFHNIFSYSGTNFIVHDWGDKFSSDVGLSYRPAT